MGQEFDIRVISLLSAQERRQHMAALFAGSDADWSYFDAIAGASLPSALPAYDRQRRLRLLGYDLRQNEIACFLSHREVWRHAVASGRPVLVLEDDVQVRSGALGPVLEQVAQLCQRLAPPLLCVRLGHLFAKDWLPVAPMGPGWELVRYKKDPSTAMAYVLSPQVAARLLQASTTFSAPVDDFMWRGWEHGCCLLDVVPSLFFTADAQTPSTIGQRVKQPIAWWHKVPREWHRLLQQGREYGYVRRSAAAVRAALAQGR